MNPTNVDCSGRACDCRSNPDRRDFLKWSALAAAGLATQPWAVAGPFTREDFNRLVPADKKLKPDWVKSLFARGERTVYRWPESRLIGMPVGGICAGQVYLGGDGRLWHWDIFNQHIDTGSSGPHYAKPMEPASPFAQGFALKINAGGRTQVRAFDHTGWREVQFTGEYPLGIVEYRDADSPVAVSLEAFSPFIPLNVEDSSLPATIQRFTVRNTSALEAEVEIAGWLENAVCLHSAENHEGSRTNRIARTRDATMLVCQAQAAKTGAAPPNRPDIVFDDFERETYAPWTAEGKAFGRGPVAQREVPEYQGELGIHGQRTVNTHAAAPANDVGGRDAQTGMLTSAEFTIERGYLTFLIGGGGHKGRTCMNLLVDGRTVRTAAGANANRMQAQTWNVRRWEGQKARLQIVDQELGPWGNIGIDHIVFTDQPPQPVEALQNERDFGSLVLALLHEGAPRGAVGFEDKPAAASLPAGAAHDVVFDALAKSSEDSATLPFGEPLVGALGRKLKLAPGASATVTFALCWHFPNFKLDKLPPGRHYAKRFNSAPAVAVYLAANFTRLREQTLLWHRTWYDATLPYWFLDRTFLNTSILATSTCFRLGNGRFWAWEGVGCCHGTCGHVWQYAHAMARLFPELERDTRERVDFGSALQKNGAIFFRGEFNDFPAVDGQAGTVLRALREHQMCADDAWLKKNWPQIRRAIQWLIDKDGDGDGLIESNQHNTLDTDWFGPVAWLSGLYVAALVAGEAMARSAGDGDFARRCAEIAARGREQIVKRLFDGEYFINLPDPKHLDMINSGTGCHIDQVMGQSWAWQVGLGRVLPEKETVAALKSLWRFNFTPDVGPYRAAYKPGRWYAMAGEGGLLMCSFPRADWDYARAKGKGPDWAAGYFNECMNGFEYQAASHMIWEGLLLEGLAVTRMLHDRYHAARRNPWNEIECGDHYARSMASYGVYLAACGFEYDGPRQHIGFAPRLTPENFRCAFTSAEGWGSFKQTLEGGKLRAEVAVRYGQLTLRSIALAQTASVSATSLTISAAGRALPGELEARDGKASIRFAEPLTLTAGQTLAIQLS